MDSRSVGVACVLLFAACASPSNDAPDASSKAELCVNGMDDDGNHLADCEDPACAGTCDAGTPARGAATDRRKVPRNATTATTSAVTGAAITVATSSAATAP